jgi:undecaprenyl diphosphate synthase
MAAHSDAEKVPVHVAWVASDGSSDAPIARSEAERDAEDQALLSLVDAALELGVEWLSVQEPSGGRGLRHRVGELSARRVQVLDGATDEPVARPGDEGDSTDRAEKAPGVAPPVLPGVAPPALPGVAPPALRVVLVAEHSGKTGFVDAIRRLEASGVAEKKLNERRIGAVLGIPDVDLLVVTGGDRRVPDLLLWQIAYCEIVFLAEPWPHAGRRELLRALEEYRRRDRRYGGLVVTR